MSWSPDSGQQYIIDRKRMVHFVLRQDTMHDIGAPMMYLSDQQDAKDLAYHLGAAARHMEIARQIAKEHRVITKLALTPEHTKMARARERAALTMIGDDDDATGD